MLLSPSRVGINTARRLAPRVSTRLSMAPKRKLAQGNDDEGSHADIAESGSQSQPQAKRTKQTATASTGNDVAPNGQPTNKVLPVNISFPPRVAGTLRFATWNVCGLAAAQKKVRCHSAQSNGPRTKYAFQGFKYYVEAEDPDVLVLTETKASTVLCETFFRHVQVPDMLQVNNDPVDPVISARFPYRTWAISGRKTYGASILVMKRVVNRNAAL